MTDLAKLLASLDDLPPAPNPPLPPMQRPQRFVTNHDGESIEFFTYGGPAMTNIERARRIVLEYAEKSVGQPATPFNAAKLLSGAKDADHVVKIALAAIESLAGPLELLREAGERFREYEAHHTQKTASTVFHGPDPRGQREEGYEKAHRNAEIAKRIEDALAGIEVVRVAPVPSEGLGK